MAKPRVMALTPELVVRVHREIADAGPLPGRAPMTDRDSDDLVEALISVAEVAADVWIFAYGSLIWRPACPIDGQRPALLRS